MSQITPQTALHMFVTCSPCACPKRAGVRSIETAPSRPLQPRDPATPHLPQPPAAWPPCRQLLPAAHLPSSGDSSERTTGCEAAEVPLPTASSGPGAGVDAWAGTDSRSSSEDASPGASATPASLAAPPLRTPRCPSSLAAESSRTTLL